MEIVLYPLHMGLQHSRSQHIGSQHVFSIYRLVAIPILLLAGALALPIATMAAQPSAAMAQPPSGKVRKFNFAPPADLQYQIKARQSGLTLDGTAQVQWQWSEGKFSISTETRAALLGKVFNAQSVGTIDAFGLAPTTFVDERLRKSATTTTFDRVGNVIRFSTSSVTYPIKGGEQDRNSVIWQLIGTARGAGPAFKAGSEWRFFVAGQRDAQWWTFSVGKREKIRTAMGVIDAVHVVRAPPADSKAQKLDIWLAPSLQMVPARLRFADADGDFIEQTLESVNKL